MQNTVDPDTIDQIARSYKFISLSYFWLYSITEFPVIVELGHHHVTQRYQISLHSKVSGLLCFQILQATITFYLTRPFLHEDVARFNHRIICRTGKFTTRHQSHR